jgi:hypothetical protein
MAEAFSGESTRCFAFTEDEAVGRITHDVANWPNNGSFPAKDTMTVAFALAQSASARAASTQMRMGMMM